MSANKTAYGGGGGQISTYLTINAFNQITYGGGGGGQISTYLTSYRARGFVCKNWNSNGMKMVPTNGNANA